MPSVLFTIPFATGVFHALNTKNKKEKQWGLTNSIVGTTAAYSTLAAIREEYFLKPEHQKMIQSKLSPPAYIMSTFLVACVHSGAYFCLGNLLTKKAYPVFQDE